MVSAVVVLVSVVYRTMHPSVLMQVGRLASLTAWPGPPGLVAGHGLPRRVQRIDRRRDHPAPTRSSSSSPPRRGGWSSPPASGCWASPKRVAPVARRTRPRRAALPSTRFWAGSSRLSAWRLRSAARTLTEEEYGRVLEPAVGDVACSSCRPCSSNGRSAATRPRTSTRPPWDDPGPDRFQPGLPVEFGIGWAARRGADLSRCRRRGGPVAKAGQPGRDGAPPDHPGPFAARRRLRNPLAGAEAT